jgi:hypothetical protein
LQTELDKYIVVVFVFGFMLKSDENSEAKEKSDLLQSSKKRKCKEMFLHLLQEQVHDNVELQQAVEKFKKASEEEIKRLVKYEGVGIHDAIDAIVAKIRYRSVRAIN